MLRILLVWAGFMAITLGAFAAPPPDDEKAKGQQESQLFHRMAPLNVGVFQRGRSYGNVLFEITLEAAELADTELLLANEVRLRSAFIDHLQRYFDLRYDPARPLDLTYMTAVLQGACDEALHGEHATVLIQAARLSR